MHLKFLVLATAYFCGDTAVKMVASSVDGRGNFDRDSDQQECNGAHKRLRLIE